MEEVKARALGLRAELRRLLILVDGHTPLSRLAIFVRGSEIDFLIAELEFQHLVTTGIGAAATPTAAVPAAAAPANLEPTTAQLLAVRRAAIGTLHDLLGPDADVLAVQIERGKDAQALRVAITDIRQTLDRQLGTHAGQRFLDAVRAAAEGTR